MADDEGVNLNVLCSFCKKPAVNKKVKCLNCLAVFHNSCSNKKTKKCCDKQDYIEEKIIEITEDHDSLDLSSDEKSFAWENKVLKDMNIDLRENIKLLKEKIGNLETENRKLKELVGKEKQETLNSNEELINIIHIMKIKFENNFESLAGKINSLDLKINKISNDKTKKDIPINSSNTKTLSAIKQQTHRDKSMVMPGQSNAGSPKQLYTEVIKQSNLKMREITSNENNLAILEDHQRKQMNDIINLTIPTNSCQESHPARETNDCEWQSVKPRRLNRTRPQVGTATSCSIDNVDNNFSGKPEKTDKKAWLFISRVKDIVTEDDIKTYIKAKTKLADNDVLVTRFPTKYDNIRKDGKCFKVGIKYDLKDVVYESDFWPSRVTFSRFKFDIQPKESDFLDKPLQNL